jgi:O-antigen ligase
LCLPFGELGNSNAFGTAGVLGVIFGTYQILYPGGRFSRLIAIGGLVPMLWAIARTGSRTAMVMLAATIVVGFFRLNSRQKIFFALGGTIAIGALLAVLPENLYKRYATLLASAEDVQGDIGQESAVESTESRLESLRKSITITLQNPLVGVGPGNFMVAEAEMAKAAGERPAWLQTHNGYTQVSSETGFPGFFLYAAAMISVAGLIRRVARLQVTAQEGRDLVFLAKYLQIGYISYAIAVFFGVSLYSLYMPVLIALMVATYRSAEEYVLTPERPEAPYVAPPLKALSRLPLPGKTRWNSRSPA